MKKVKKMKLTRDNYFSKEAEGIYLGSTSFKSWDILGQGCEAKELAKLKGEWEEEESKALLVGSYVHAWNSGELEEFKAKNKDKIYQKNGKMYADFLKADNMIKVLKDDPLVSKVREGEKEKIFTGEIAGVPFKIQVDILNLKMGYFADLKTTADLRKTYWVNGSKGTFIDQYNYYTQIAIYAEILRQNIGLKDYLEPYLIVVDKQEIPDHEVIYMGKGFIQEYLEYIESRLPNIMEVREGLREPIKCGKCEYCRSKKRLKQPISLSDYEFNLNIY
ncbi:PD-(D/E)XK nuclease-like domain-containing protein [Hathewaya histolytica]|uniref:PD-(D/E)XK nuclease-like domain-containing protein n=1 Tax=Hathewaya histolytica TaxID=1498 RepID=UPI003B685FD6